jgi:hypothetical protein
MHLFSSGPLEADRIMAGDGGWDNPKPSAGKAVDAPK